MAYEVRSNRALETKLRRIVDRQLAVAISELHEVGREWSDDGIHDARQHAKKRRCRHAPAVRRFAGSPRGSIERLGHVNESCRRALSFETLTFPRRLGISAPRHDIGCADRVRTQAGTTAQAML
jgi:hypothetical protein